MYDVLGMVASLEKYVKLIRFEQEAMLNGSQLINNEIVLFGIHLNRFKKTIEVFHNVCKIREGKIQDSLSKMVKTMEAVEGILVDNPQIPLDIDKTHSFMESLNDVQIDLPDRLPPIPLDISDIQTTRLLQVNQDLREDWSEIYLNYVKTVAAIEHRSFKNQSE